MTGHLVRSRRVQMAGMCALLGISVFIVSVMAGVGAADEPPRAAAAEASPATIQPADTTPDDDVDAAVEFDPFSPTRQPPPVRYGAPVTLNPAGAVATAMPAALQLVGTVVHRTPGADGSFVVCQLGNAPPHVVRIGQKIGEYTLREVTQGGARFVDHDGTPLDLRVPTHGS
jgi:hypothetical protein